MLVEPLASGTKASLVEGGAALPFLAFRSDQGALAFGASELPFPHLPSVEDGIPYESISSAAIFESIPERDPWTLCSLTAPSSREVLMPRLEHGPGNRQRFRTGL